jgi:hypothetical protein
MGAQARRQSVDPVAQMARFDKVHFSERSLKLVPSHCGASPQRDRAPLPEAVPNPLQHVARRTRVRARIKD